MSIAFLPDVYTRATTTTVVVPVSGVPDLTDPSNSWVVIPSQVEMTLTLIEGDPRGDRGWAHVSVIGPRRLKSGVAGRPITTLGWESARNDGPRGHVARPDWLTKVLADHLPEGWSPSLLDLKTVSAESTPVCGSQCPTHLEHVCRRSRGHQAGICRNAKQKGEETCTWDPAGDELGIRT